MSAFTRRVILVFAAIVMLASLGVSTWIANESKRCELERQIYRFGQGCVRATPPVILKRGLQRT